MGRTGRTTDQLGNLLEGQTAPEVSDDGLALVDRQGLQLGRGHFGVDLSGTDCVRTVFKPAERFGTRGHLVFSTATRGGRHIDRLVANRAEQPGDRVLWRLALH